ncbi:omptin family outer membrane protease [Legionella maioricensis]|uniref:Omptin family outer membrane protease n=1 Tax=Legionella maioricensis TaxID=2896528 RepID=A0A9X2D1Z1_9GAMM|nr:omptin family outer membrane protease [Legionella maioricensis]MCL9685001.1 omptin family outer membrane protease [Legionella maioricensis]MCL9688102.1 omptin family outer membrane protease [Legionella maioricensis]
MNTSGFAGLTLFTLLCIPSVFQANPDRPGYHDIDGFSLDVSVGYLSGKSKELVYDAPTGRKISELDWKISGESIIRGEANFHLFQWLDFNAQGWINLQQGRAVMDDYDWLNPNQISWTHWSHHEDTKLRQANEFDLNLRSWFIQQTSYQVAGIAGYQRTLFSFLGKGGCFTYNNGENIGCFIPGESVIGYKQVYESPYIGLAGKYLVKSFEFNGMFKFSNRVNAKDVDQHYLRNLTFHEQSSQSKYYNVVLNAGYFIKPQIKLFAEGSLGYFPNTMAKTEIIDNSTGAREYLPRGSAGLGNRNYIIALGVQYRGKATDTK